MNSQRQKTILLVEDEFIISMTEKSQLENYGYQVIIAGSGEKAIDAFMNGYNIDLVLMDINLGAGIDGTEAAQLILNHRNVPIVFVSSHTEPEVVEKTEKITSFGYVVKSSSITVLDASIKMAFKLFEANRKVSESESQYHALVEGMPGIVYSYSSKRGGIYYSSSAKTILGYAPERLLTDPLLWQNSIHPDDLPRVKEVIAKSEKGAPVRVEYRIRDAQGAWHWFDDRSFGARNDGAELIIDGLALDISERVQAERSYTELFQEMLDGFAVHEIICDSAGNPIDYRFLAVNPAFERMTGLNAEKIIGKTVLEVLPETEKTWIEKYGQVALTGEPAVFEDYTKELNKYFMVTAFKSAPKRFSCIFIDISERKIRENEILRTKKLLQAIIESPKDMIIMAIDRDYRYLCFNATHKEAMKTAYGKEVSVGMNILDCISSREDLVNAKDNYDRALRGESHSTLQVFGYIEKTFFESHYNPIYNDHGEVIGITAFARDITERINAAALLQDNKEKLELALGSANMGVWQYYIKQNKRVFDAQVCRLLGIAPDSFGGTAEEFYGRLHPDDLDKIRSALKATIERDLPYMVEYRVLWDDGSVHYIAARGKLVSEKNQASAIIGTLWDISDRKHSEAAIRESDEKYRVLFNNEIYAICIFDLETLRLLDVNAAYERLYGYSRAELISDMTIHDITAERQASDEATVQAKQNGTTYIPLRYHRKKDGTVFPVEIVGGPYEWKGRNVMFALAHDISDRKKAEDSLREALIRQQNIIEGTHAGTWEWNVQTGETIFNEEWAQIIGYTLDELKPFSIKTWETLCHPDDLKRSDELLERHFAGELPYYNYDSRMRHKDGSWVWVHDRGRVMTRTADGKPLMMFGTHSDITIRKRHEAELEKTARENNELLRELQHRAKNSFNMISSMIGLASGTAISLETKNALDHLSLRVASVSELYSLLYSTGSFTAVQLDDYCNRIAVPLIGMNENISLRTELDSVTIPVKTAAPIGLILTEFVINALKHAFPAGKRGTITIKLKKLANGQVTLEVIDDGIGLPEGFTVLSRAGMGLNLIQGLTEQINGFLKIEPGAKGTRFTLIFGIDMN